jgi:hypothetical protein
MASRFAAELFDEHFDPEQSIDDVEAPDDLDRIYVGLRLGDERVAQAAMAFAECLQRMAHAAMRGDNAELSRAYLQACELELEDDAEEVDESGGGLQQLYHGLRLGFREAAQMALAVAGCIQRMVHAASRGDQRGLEHWHRECRSMGDGHTVQGDE